MTLAQDCGNKAELAHIQELGLTLDQAQSLVRMIGKCSHRSFPALQRFLQHDGRYFLVWELTELSLNKVFASKCPITESELAQIVWPVLKGIRVLHSRGRALATLGAETILVTETGGVKIAGVEHSCQTDPADMNAATLKLAALATIISGLLKNNGFEIPWSAEAQGLPQRLVENSLDELLRDPFFTRMEGDGGLKLVVQVVNKTAYHKVEFVRERDLGAI